MSINRAEYKRMLQSLAQVAKVSQEHSEVITSIRVDSDGLVAFSYGAERISAEQAAVIMDNLMEAHWNT